MTIPTLVKAAVAGPLDRSSIERACAEEKMTLFSLYDAFASDVATKYFSGIYSWQFCDDAMNSLFTYAHPISKSGLPAFAFEVYSAFDEGEYRSEGEALSRKLIEDALKKAPNQSPEPTRSARGSS